MPFGLTNAAAVFQALVNDSLGHDEPFLLSYTLMTFSSSLSLWRNMWTYGGGFANFYRRFIQDYNKLVAPLTQLTSVVLPYVWTPEAQQAFTDVKCWLTMTPVLVHPNPSSQFNVEVDVLDSGVGAVLSQ